MPDRADYQRVLTALKPLTVLYPNWKPADSVWKSYVMVLADIEPELLERAIVQLVGEPREFMPVPGIIRQLAFDLKDVASNLPDAYEAWEQVLADISRGMGHPIAGNGMEPEAHPLAVKAAQMIGGWRFLAQSENQYTDRARFIDAYERAKEKQAFTARMLPETRRYIAELADAMAEPKRLEDHGDA